MNTSSPIALLPTVNMVSITSGEMNYFVCRYLHESGFTHSAFAFGYEAGINKSTIDGNLVPPGAFVRFVQKGLQYLELESNLSSSDADRDDDFSLLQPLDLITKDVYELQNIVKEKKRCLEDNNHKERDKDRECKLDYANEWEKDQQTKGKEEQEKDKAQKEKEQDKGNDAEKPQANHADARPCEDKDIFLH